MLVNGEPKWLITPSRGIRQRDPLPPISPFPILLCTEGLHGLIQQVANSGDITGFALCRRWPKLTHLFFADDSILFCIASPRECDKIMDLLSEYESVFG